MGIPGNWEVAGVFSRRRQFALVSGSCLILALSIGGSVRGDESAQQAEKSAQQAASTFQQYCFQCHGEAASGGLNLQELASQDSFGRSFREWEKVAVALEQRRMPPLGMPQPSDTDRERAVASIRNALRDYVAKHAGDPGRVTVRRLTSSEYAYTIEDLTGVALDVDQEFAGDAVGGEGFTNYGDVQFMQDATMERYLETAKRIADHAVIGAGPLSFYEHPGKTGFEMGALARVNEIHAANGFRTVSGEGGRPFGLERYGKALYAAWRYRHRVALGEGDVTLKALAKREGINARFAEHIWSVLNKASLGYPSSEVAARWRSLPTPEGGAKVVEEAVRADCEKIQTFLATWPSWLFARGDVAAGGAGDESPLVFSDETLKAEPTRRFEYPLGERGPRRGRPPADPNAPTRVYLHVASVNPTAEKPLVIWRNPTLVTGAPDRRRPGEAVAEVTGPAAAPPATAASAPETGEAAPAPPTSAPLRAVLSEEDANRLSFGKSPDGTAIGENDFATTGTVFFDIPATPAAGARQLQVTAEIGTDRNAVFRLILSNREDGGSARGAPTRALLGVPGSEGYESFKAGVMELAALWPPNAQGEANPSDKDPVPEPFDNTYNTPEHDAFVLKVKYQRVDQYLMENVLDEPVKVKLDQAWNDLFASFDYHDAYLGMLAGKYKLDLKGKRMANLTAADIEALPAGPRQYAQALRAHYEKVISAQAAAQPGHIEDAIEFAGRAWRRPLTAAEKDGLRAFYRRSREARELDHIGAMRALLARILVSPSFLYRTEQVADDSPVRPLSGWELASRLSYFLWSSTPDDELRRAAAAGELSQPEQLNNQAKRMLADPKARRMATEFFGQWLGFYRFDEYRGVDASRFPEFTDEVKSAMYDEAVSFFEYILRSGRPVREILHADYAFLNQALAKYYGVNKEVASNGPVELVQGANEFKRGGILRFGAVLTATSAPLRTSPVKRGDWVLRRVLGTAVPPPPADAGSLPADDKNFGEMTLREKLESHKRNATCAACHTRIDPLGFPLEHYDAVGRWRDRYQDGKPIEDSGELSDKTPVAGLDGLLDYMKTQEKQILRTLSHKLLGYSLGRTVQASDQPLVERMVEAGGNASLSELVSEIVASRQFRFRLGRGEAAPAIAANSSGNGTLAAREGPAVKNRAQAGTP